MKTTKKGIRMVLAAVLTVTLAFGLTGCLSVLQIVAASVAISRQNTQKKTEQAAQIFIGMKTDELLTIGSPRYAQTGGNFERYAFPHWQVRQAAGEKIKESAKTKGETLVVFNCTEGIVKSFETRADETGYFFTWERGKTEAVQEDTIN